MKIIKYRLRPVKELEYLIVIMGLIMTNIIGLIMTNIILVILIFVSLIKGII